MLASDTEYYDGNSVYPQVNLTDEGNWNLPCTDVRRRMT